VDREQVRAAFANPKEFTTSPLYRCLSPTVAATGPLLDLACQGRPGQYPTFLFFGAVQLLLLAGTDHPLARFYPSIVGERALSPESAGPALVSFGRQHAAELAQTIRTRLVQTNQVQRAIGLRLGLSMIADEVPPALGTSRTRAVRPRTHGCPAMGGVSKPQLGPVACCGSPGLAVPLPSFAAALGE